MTLAPLIVAAWTAATPVPSPASSPASSQASQVSQVSKAWQVSLGSSAMRPCVIAGDLVLQGLANGDVVAVSRSSQAIAWRAHVGARSVQAAPTPVGDVVIAGAFGGPAFALDRQSGAARWRAPMDGVIGSAVLLRERTVLLGTIGGLTALDLDTGYERGRATTLGGVPAVAVIGDRVIFESFTDNALIAADVDEVGAYTIMTEAWRLRGPAVAHDNGAAITLAGFQAESIPIVDGVAFVPTNVAELWAVDIATGKKRWGYEPGGSVISAPAVAHGLVYVVATNGSSVDAHRSSRIAAVDASTGVERWTVSLPHVLAMGGAVVVDRAGAGGTVALATDARELLGFDATTGARAFTVKLRGAGWWAPCAATDGTLYVGDDAGTLTAVH